MSFAGLRHFGKAEALVEEVQAYLEDTYCGHISVETSQLSSLEEREWLADRFEELKKTSFSTEDRRQLAKVMLESQVQLQRRRVHVEEGNCFKYPANFNCSSHVCNFLTFVGI